MTNLSTVAFLNGDVLKQNNVKAIVGPTVGSGIINIVWEKAFSSDVYYVVGTAFNDCVVSVVSRSASSVRLKISYTEGQPAAGAFEGSVIAFE